jgi:uncharacterized protein (TIGR02001 family)
MMYKILTVAALLLPSLPALAQDTAPSDFDVTATITAVSDYRFRGLSLSDRDPALQGSVEVSHSSGFYVGTWGSTIKGTSADVEVDLYGGWRGKAGAIDLDAGAVAYVYPGSSDFNYVEMLASTATTIGPAQLKLGAAYAPSQSNIGGADNVYFYGEASAGIPSTPVTVKAHVGHEDGSLAGPTGKKWDWSIGADVVLDRFTLGLSYVDTNVDRLVDPAHVARPGVVASVGVQF